eukprot:349674-Chlamydomonas_euryale.AAC.4
MHASVHASVHDCHARHGRTCIRACMAMCSRYCFGTSRFLGMHSYMHAPVKPSGQLETGVRGQPLTDELGFTQARSHTCLYQPTASCKLQTALKLGQCQVLAVREAGLRIRGKCVRLSLQVPAGWRTCLQPSASGMAQRTRCLAAAREGVAV